MLFNRLCRRMVLAMICGSCLPTPCKAQDNPLSTNSRFLYNGVKLLLLGSAERMPEEHYSFKPTDAVRSFGQIVGHAADAQYRFCSMVSGETNPTPNIEKTRTAKSELIAALKDAFAYCDRTYNTITDATGVDMVKLGPGMPKLGVLAVNSLHSTLHYGNLITYMRLKNVVPPSSDPEYMSQISRPRQ